MMPTVQLTITPDLHSDWYRVQLVTTVTRQDGTDHDVILYDQLREFVHLSPAVGAELWTLTVVCATAHDIESALHTQIANGAQTLMGDGSEHQESLF